ncbi:MAG: hypothetical protein IIB53_13120 [Planctomycetes bacterium]|nr:hypothetical protein [Planctomycetota bacterium]
MSKKFNLFAALATLTAGALVTSLASEALAAGGGEGPVVYVTGQDLFYDTIVLGDLPPNGPFQLLEMAGPTGLQTEFGPGDRGYVGGRWWVDINSDGEMDPADVYFLCPLLPPGREEP